MIRPDAEVEEMAPPRPNPEAVVPFPPRASLSTKELPRTVREPAV